MLSVRRYQLLQLQIQNRGASLSAERMISIDPRTAILIGGVMSGLMSLVLYSIKRSYPASIRGLQEWSLSLALVFVGGMLAIGRDVLPDVLSISLSRLLIGLGLYLFYYASQRFFGVTPQPRRWLIAIAGVMLVQLWFTFVEPDYRTRLVISNLLAATLFALQARLVFQQGAFTLGRLLALLVALGMTAVQLMRLVTTFTMPLGTDFFDESPQHLLYLTSFALCILLNSIAAVLLATERLRTELEHLADHDSLTDTLTRRRMTEVANKELERCRRHQRSMALMMIDLDHFKAINDTYGHPTGDRLLVEFAAKVRPLLREADQLGRHGGEEFVVLLPDTVLTEAIVVAQRILDTCTLTGEGPSHTVSVGITINRVDDDSVDALLLRADTALYQAKAKGRNRMELG
jgi:diguanylate cyclase (GGDEF)-like protein